MLRVEQAVQLISRRNYSSPWPASISCVFLTKAAAPAITALIGGEVQLTFATRALWLPHVKSGKLRALAVTSAQPSALVPGFAYGGGLGLPGYESVAIDRHICAG